MTYLPSLIKKINEFHRQAFASKLLKQAAPGDKYEDFEDVPEPEPDYSRITDPKYQKITKEEEPLPESPEMSEEYAGGDSLYFRIAESLEDFDNQDIANEVFVIAEEYKRAVQINGGFTKVLSDISKVPSVADFVKDYGFVSKREAEAAQSFLKEMANSLKQLASDGPQTNEAEAVKQLSQAKQEAIGVMSRQEMSGQEQKFERADKTGLTSGVAGPKNFGDSRINKYEEDIKALTKALGDPNVPENHKQRILTLINFNRDIVYAMKDLKDLQGTLSTIPDEKVDAKQQASQEVETAYARLKSLKDQRSKIMLELRDFHQDQRVKEFQQKANEANLGGRYKEKNWYDLQSQLAEIRLSRKVNKTPAIEALKELIRATGTLDPKKDFQSQEIPPDKLSLLKKNFDLANLKMITKEEYDRTQTEGIGEQQGREETPEYEKGKGPGGPRTRMDQLPEEQKIHLQLDESGKLVKASFSALVYQFQIDIASATQAARQIIYENGLKEDPKNLGKFKKDINTKYKDLIDTISKAIQNKDRQTLYDAKKNLIAQVSAEVFTKTKDKEARGPQLQGYIEVISLEPHFRKVLDGIKTVTKTVKNDPKPKLDAAGNLVTANFSEQDKETFRYILNDIGRLKKLFAKYSSIAYSVTVPHERLKITPRFKKVIEDMSSLEINLVSTLNIHRPTEKQLYPERSPLAKEIGKEQKLKEEELWKLKTPEEKLEHEMKRKKIQDQFDKGLKSNSIYGRMSLLRRAQEVVPSQEIDKATADKLANEFFDRVFNEAYQKMLSSLQS